MPYLLALSPLHYFFSISLMLTSLFLILIVLVQRGRGGGLTGALGGMGGQSAFGTKAGDLFTRITIVVATIWILLSIGALKVLNRPDIRRNATAPTTIRIPADGSGAQTPATTGEGATGEGATGEGADAAKGNTATTPPTSSPAEPSAPATTAPATTAPAGETPADAGKK